MPSDRSARWILAIDFGTSFTAAAIRADGQLRVLETDGVRRLPSAVFRTRDGYLLVGESAQSRAGMEPERVERTPKAYLDVAAPSIPLGDELVPVVDVVGRILNAVWREALRQHGGVAPAQVRLTHPASWSSRRQELLRDAAGAAGIPEPLFLSEPEGAAIYLTSEGVTGKAIPEGAPVAVYDLGGGTFDTTILRRTGERFEVIGSPGGDESIGGELFDDLLYRRLGESGLDASDWERLQTSEDRDWRRANYEFRQQVRAAKEAVSRAASYPIYVPSPVSRDLQVTRDEFEELIRDNLVVTLDIFEETIRGAGLEPTELAAIYLVGGSARIPLVSRLVRERFGRADFKGDPKTVVALGAARAELGWPPAAAETLSEDAAQAGAPAAPVSAKDQRPATAPVTTTRERNWAVPLGLSGALAGLALFVGSVGADALGLSTSETSSERFGGLQMAGAVIGVLLAAVGGVVATWGRWQPLASRLLASRVALATAIGLLMLGIGALVVLWPKSPTAAELLIGHVPEDFRDTCESQDSTGGEVAAAVACTPVGPNDSVEYRQFSDGTTMNGFFDEQKALQETQITFKRLQPLTQGRSPRPASELTGCPGFTRGRVFCFVNGSTSRVTWTDELLRIVSQAESSDGNKRALFGAFRRGVFGPVK